MIDEDVALMKAATKKPRALVKMSDTRWNVLYSVLHRFRALNPAMQLLYANLRSVSIDAAKVRFTCTRFCFFVFSSFYLVCCSFPFCQRSEFRTYWEQIDEVLKWKQIEELQFILMRIQPIVLSCQAERVPTLSSIAIWLDQLRCAYYLC